MREGWRKKEGGRNPLPAPSLQDAMQSCASIPTKVLFFIFPLSLPELLIEVFRRSLHISISTVRGLLGVSKCSQANIECSHPSGKTI